MALLVDIEKQMGDFRLSVQFEAENETLALLGASGCGKSVTLRCIAGILKPDTGHIVLDGVTLFDSARRIDLPPQKRQVGYLFQQYALFPHMTVRQNIAAAVMDKRGRDSAVAEQLRRFRLEAVADLRPKQLSGGQQQRAALARILASRPKAILLDEPFSALDGYLRSQLEPELTEALAAFPGPVLWVSHDRGEAFRNCRRVCVMDHGASEPVVSTEVLFSRPSTEAAARLSGCQNFADCHPVSSGIFLSDWGLPLRCVPPATPCRVGIRAHHIRPAAPDTENAFSCTVVRAVEDLSAVAVFLRPDGAAETAPLLRMELDKITWAALPDKNRLTVAISAENILFF